jgi:hypothetical protein
LVLHLRTPWSAHANLLLLINPIHGFDSRGSTYSQTKIVPNTIDPLPEGEGALAALVS